MILICGLPNAGKTTYSARFSHVLHYDDFADISADAEYAACNKAAAALEEVVVEGVYGSVKRRKELLAVCADKQEKICIWIDTPMQVCINREDRGRPKAVVTGAAADFEPPTVEEGWEKVIVIRNQRGNLDA